MLQNTIKIQLQLLENGARDSEACIDQRDSETTMMLPGSWSNTGLSIPQKTSQTAIMQEANIGGDNDHLSIIDQPRSSDDQTLNLLIHQTVLMRSQVLMDPLLMMRPAFTSPI
jgi:hypothetical protein